MKTLLKSNNLYQNIMYNYRLVIDILCQRCDSFYLYCFYELKKNEDLIDVCNFILDLEPNKILKNSFIGIEQCKKNDLVLKFKLDENSRYWLLMHEDFKSYSEVFYREYIRKNGDRVKKGILEDPEFIDSNNITLLRYDKFYETLYINDENEFFKVLDKEFSKIFNKKQSFILKFKRMKQNQNDEDIIKYFSSDNFDIGFFTEYLRYKNNKQYSVDDFFLNTQNIELFIKIIINKLNEQYDLSLAQILLCFYGKDYLEKDGIQYNTNDIDKYVLSLDKDIAIQLFNAFILSRAKSGQLDCAIMDKIVELICKSGLFTYTSKLLFSSQFIAAWNETFCVKDIKTNWKLLIKKKSLLALFNCSYNNEQVDLFSILKSIEKNENIAYINIYKVAYAYFYGLIFKQDYKKAINYLMRLSKITSNIDCQYDLARCYLNGWGTEKDIEQAKYWFGKAAENGHPKAQEQLDQITKKV